MIALEFRPFFYREGRRVSLGIYPQCAGTRPVLAIAKGRVYAGLLAGFECKHLLAVAMSLFMVKLLPRQTVAVLSLTGIMACKLVVLLLLLEAGYAQPYVGTNAQGVFLPAANRILTTGMFNDLDTSSASKVAPGYAV